MPFQLPNSVKVYSINKAFLAEVLNFKKAIKRIAVNY